MDIPKLYQEYLEKIKDNGFLGDIQSDYASRLAAATDNSIYQVVPKCVLFPKSHKDIQISFELASEEKFQAITFSPRGGGTGTNGQSLTEGIMVDCSRYMNKIKKIDLKSNTVVVEPGVVLDQLNEVLEKDGVFFAPNLSPSNRATVGGMANTDACGKGSRIYGRTSEHIVSLICLLVNGENLETKCLSFSELEIEKAKQSKSADIHQKIEEQITSQVDEIESQFPKLTRFMTGYNLAKVIDQEKQTFNLSYLIAGSEGTLVYVTELTLKLTPIPKQKMLFAIQYSSFDSALREGKDLLKFDPAALETIDDNILKLAEHDEIYAQVSHMLEIKNDCFPQGINLLEFTVEASKEFESLKDEIKTYLNLAESKGQILGFYCALEANEINALWDLRKKGVGLLGAMKGTRKPIPFMEDTAVPPEHLADYIAELRILLDGYGLKYGMFGHVDVGCLHMRPALDINTEADRRLVVELTQKVNALVKKYHGIYWSEHGKGFRSEYIVDYFGEKLYQTLREIKGLFDPHNQLNPGKIVVPADSDAEVVKVDGPFKGYRDMQVPESVRTEYAGAFNCNGNAACLDYSPHSVMCPSAKVSRDWVNSPKGRSTLLREWLRLKQKDKTSDKPSENSFVSMVKKFSYLWKKQEYDFSHEVYQSLSKCLGCKGCATACPIKVDIPSMKPKFLNDYHKKYPRRLRDYVFAMSEESAYWQSKIPALSSKIMKMTSVQTCIEGLFSIKDTPVPNSIGLKKALIQRQAPDFSLEALNQLDVKQKAKTVCLIQDAFNSVYDTEVLLATYDLLSVLGYSVYVLPFRVNGKAYHTKGFLKKFKKIAQESTAFYNQITAKGVPIIGIEPSLTLCYRDEYVEALGDDVKFKVALIQEWLSSNLSYFNFPQSIPKAFSLYAHCTEKSLAASAVLAWPEIFKAFGHRLNIQDVGCCGMAGTFGHEKENIEDSKGIYALSWKNKLSSEDINKNVLATGFSCRSQIKRMEQKKARHPVSALYEGIINE